MTQVYTVRKTPSKQQAFILLTAGERKLGVNVAWFQILGQPVVTDFNLGLLFPHNGINDK